MLRDESEIIRGDEIKLNPVLLAAESGLVRIGLKVAVIAPPYAFFNEHIIDFIAFSVLRNRRIMKKDNGFFPRLFCLGD